MQRRKESTFPFAGTLTAIGATLLLAGATVANGITAPPSPSEAEVKAEQVASSHSHEDGTTHDGDDHAVDGPAPAAEPQEAPAPAPVAPGVAPEITKPETKWIGSPHFEAQKPGVKPKFYVIHWMNGYLAGTDKIFNSEREVATHYGIEDGKTHQYVKEEDRAWGNGNDHANTYGISVEHSGGVKQPDGSLSTPSEHTNKTSARLLAHLSQKYDWGELKRGVNVFVHKDFKNTDCPGSTDVEGIIAEANRLLKEGL